MINIIIAIPKLEDAKGIKNVLVRHGFRVTGICTIGSQAISQADGLHDGIIICSYKLADMVYTELQECMPPGFEMLLLASQQHINDCYGNNIMCLSMPLKVNDLISTVGMMGDGIERKRRRQKLQPRKRSEDEERVIREAKETLMARNHMTEEEAHKYLQKNSMDSGTNIVEMATMVLTMMRE